MNSLRLPPRTRTADEGHDNDRCSTVTAATYDTTETQSSATTVWGPGTLSGKAIKSLGEASLRGVEKLIVRWKLAKIIAILPGLTSGSSSLKNPASGEQLEKIYDDLLELSRLDFYDAKVRQKALKLIMMQIGSRETSQLLLCVVKWPQVEIVVFLSEMMPCILLLWHTTEASNASAIEADTKARLELITVYRSSLLQSETHEVLPFINFISCLAREHESACRAVIESGFLDTLVAVCDHCTFAPTVETAVQEAVITLLTCQRGWHVECAPQRLGLIWPRIDPSIPLGQTSLKMAQMTPKARKQWWRTMTSSDLIIERIGEISAILSMPELWSSCEKDMFDLSFDLLVFCDLDNDDSSFSELSIPYLAQIIAIGGSLRRSLENVLTLLPYHSKFDFFYRIIHPLSRLPDQFPAATIFCEVVKAQDPGLDPVDFFIQFTMDVADCSQENAQAIVDAEIISLVIANRSSTPNVPYVLRRIQDALLVKQHQEPFIRPRAGTV